RPRPTSTPVPCPTPFRAPVQRLQDAQRLVARLRDVAARDSVAQVAVPTRLQVHGNERQVKATVQVTEVVPLRELHAVHDHQVLRTEEHTSELQSPEKLVC